jgi:DNA-binding CsgD family transcriptional regulator
MDDTPGIQVSTRLTRRQAQVIELAAQGLSGKQIARCLGLSRRTVEDHFAAARHRLGAATMAELVAVAMESRAPAGMSATSGSCSETSGFCSEMEEFPNSTIDRRNHPGRPTVMTPERLSAARELMRDHTIAEVARKLGISRTTLYTHLSAIATG